jgi:hypothetical protein
MQENFVTGVNEDLFYEKIPPLAHLPDRACRVEYGSGGGIFCRVSPDK